MRLAKSRCSILLQIFGVFSADTNSFRSKKISVGAISNRTLAPLMPEEPRLLIQEKPRGTRMVSYMKSRNSDAMLYRVLEASFAVFLVLAVDAPLT
jgi:hypothetical protein